MSGPPLRHPSVHHKKAGIDKIFQKNRVCCLVNFLNAPLFKKFLCTLQTARTTNAKYTSIKFCNYIEFIEIKASDYAIKQKAKL